MRRVDQQLVDRQISLLKRIEGIELMLRAGSLAARQTAILHRVESLSAPGYQRAAMQPRTQAQPPAAGPPAALGAAQEAITQDLEAKGQAFAERSSHQQP